MLNTESKLKSALLIAVFIPITLYKPCLERTLGSEAKYSMSVEGTSAKSVEHLSLYSEMS